MAFYVVMVRERAKMAANDNLRGGVDCANPIHPLVFGRVRRVSTRLLRFANLKS